MLTKEEMPACPVATTVALIGSKWKLLIIRNLLAEKGLGGNQPKGADRQPALDGSRWYHYPYSLSRGAAEGGICADRTWQKPETHSGFHAGMGRSI